MSSEKGERRCPAQIISNGFMKWSAWDVVINIMLMEVTSGRGNARNVRAADHNISGRKENDNRK